MEANWIRKTDNIPIITSTKGEKNYFTLDEQGCLKQFFWEKGNWTLTTEHLFKQKIQGFDAAIDKEGNIYLLGYDDKGALFCNSPLGARTLTAPFYQDSNKKISHISVCLDKEGDLHVLCLSLDEQQEMWWLLYLNEEAKIWQKPAIIDFGYHCLEQNGLILRDFEDRIIILHRLAETENYCLVFRSIQKKDARPEKTFYFPDKHRECFFPAFLVTPENTLHISWISCEDKVLFLNYTQITSGGSFKNFFSMELPPGTLTIAPLYFMEDKIVLTCKKDDELFYLISFNGGLNWKWGRKILLDKQIQLTRFRSVPGSWPQEYVFTTDRLQIFFPDEQLIGPAEQSLNQLQKEFQNLEFLSLSLLTHAGNLQTANTSLKRKLKQKEKELAKIYSLGLATKEKMEKELKNKNMELQQMEKSFKKVLADMQESIFREKEEIASRNKDLLAQLQELRQKNEELKKENAAFLKKIAELREQVKSLTMENELLKVKKNRLPLNIFNRFKS